MVYRNFGCQRMKSALKLPFALSVLNTRTVKDNSCCGVWHRVISGHFDALGETSTGTTEIIFNNNYNIFAILF